MKNSKFKAASFVSFLVTLLLSGCTGKTFKTPDGTELWKTGALGIKPLAIGYKNKNGKNGFIPYTFVIADKVPFEKVTRFFDEESRQACLDVAGSGGSFGGAAKSCQERQSKGDYDLYFVLDRKYLAEQLNRPENSEILKELRTHYKQDARIITGISYAYGHEQQDKNNSSIMATVNSLGASSPKLKFEYENSQKKVLSDGTVFGYEMSVLCWEKGNPEHPLVHLVTSDIYGIGDDTCPQGTTINPDDIGKL